MTSNGSSGQFKMADLTDTSVSTDLKEEGMVILLFCNSFVVYFALILPSLF